MRAFTIALAQIDTTVGALAANADAIVAHAHRAAGHGARLILFPELALSGYPPEDLVLKKHFIRDCEHHACQVAARVPPAAVVIFGSPLDGEDGAHNAAAICAGGRLAGVYRKMLLPNYGVFDEKRVFRAGARPMVVEANGVRFGIHICEDSWIAGEEPSATLAAAGIDLLVNVSASPYHRGKLLAREETLRRVGAALGCPVAYCNLVGGQDELVFDGASMVLDRRGAVVARASSFQEEILLVRVDVDEPSDRRRTPAAASSYDVVTVELPEPGPPATAAPPPATAPVRTGAPAEPLEDREEVYRALTLGLRDYVAKNGFSKTVIALSGGIDSAIVAAIAVDALGRDRVVGVTMPSEFSSSETLADAGRLATSLGIELHTISIRELCETFDRVLAPLWPDRPRDATEENLQARIRGTLIMALSNKFGWLVLSTGNKSELATGYCTLYGDMVGGFAVIKDVPKTLVFRLARWRNEREGRELIPRSIIERPPTAELRPNQLDTDTLPPYDVLDPIIERYVERDLGVGAMIADGCDPETVKRVVRMIDLNEYKRRQGPPGIKITPKAFGRDRRLPITNRYREGQ